MFDILQADIVVLQEAKIQPKDLSDDMVLVSGWDCYFSLPKHKKGDEPNCVLDGFIFTSHRVFRRGHLH